MHNAPLEKEAHELTIVSSSLDELEKQNLDKVNLGQHVLAEFLNVIPTFLIAMIK